MRIVSYIIGILYMLNNTVGRFAIAILPIWWAYNLAQRGDSFLSVVGMYFLNVIILAILWALINWLLEKILSYTF